jgi:hypothetical protein
MIQPCSGVVHRLIIAQGTATISLLSRSIIFFIFCAFVLHKNSQLNSCCIPISRRIPWFTVDMAEIFGAVAAGIAVCHEMTRLAKAIHKVAKNVKNAPKDIGTLTDETVIFTGLYGDFLETYEKGSGVQKSVWIESLKVCAENVIRRLRKILCEGDALRLDADYRYSLKDTWKANWNWLIRRDVVTHLRTSLAIASQTISGFLNILCIRRLDEELSLLHSILNNPEQRSKIEAKFGVSLEEKIHCIQDKM